MSRRYVINKNGCSRKRDVQNDDDYNHQYDNLQKQKDRSFRDYHEAPTYEKEEVMINKRREFNEFVSGYGTSEKERRDAREDLKQDKREQFEFYDAKVNGVHERTRDEEKRRYNVRDKDRGEYQDYRNHREELRNRDKWNQGSQCQKEYIPKEAYKASTAPMRKFVEWHNNNCNPHDRNLSQYKQDIITCWDSGRNDPIYWANQPFLWYDEKTIGASMISNALASNVTAKSHHIEGETMSEKGVIRFMKKTLIYLPRPHKLAKIDIFYKDTKSRLERNEILDFSNDFTKLQFFCDVIVLSFIRISLVSTNHGSFLELWKIAARIKLLESMWMVELMLYDKKNKPKEHNHTLLNLYLTMQDIISRASNHFYRENQNIVNFESWKLQEDNFIYIFLFVVSVMGKLMTYDLNNLAVCAGESFDFFVGSGSVNKSFPSVCKYKSDEVKIPIFELCDCLKIQKCVHYATISDFISSKEWWQALGADATIEVPNKGKSRILLKSSLINVLYNQGNFKAPINNKIDLNHISDEELYALRELNTANTMRVDDCEEISDIAAGFMYVCYEEMESIRLKNRSSLLINGMTDDEIKNYTRVNAKGRILKGLDAIMIDGNVSVWG